MKRTIENVKHFFASGYYRMMVQDEMKNKMLSVPGIKQIVEVIKSRK